MTRLHPRPTFELETSLYAAGAGPVAGIDEVGRGPLAGPVIACAAILHRAPDGGCALPPELAGQIRDSKALSVAQREEIADWLPRFADLALGAASVRDIDGINIRQATFLAMCRAVARLPMRPGHALVDGNALPTGLPCPAEAIVKGDSLSLSISAAGIFAKVTRDRLMAALERRYPGYGWVSNAGYGTKAHRTAMAVLGLTPHHRRSFHWQSP